ncbi:MAG TPA: di-heme oxidoredictase family protein [Polyangiales bacterium]
MSTRAVCTLSALLLWACGSDPSPHHDDTALYFSGGATTVFDETRDAFAQAVPALTGDREDDFFVGNSVFNRAWVQAPASVAAFDGLGPLFNATNCSSCHFKDGRGRPPTMPGEAFNALLLRLSVPGQDVHGEPLGDPSYGGQLQDNGIHGVPPEGTPHVTYAEVPGAFKDGEAYSLRVPTYTIDQLAFGPLSPDLMISPRVAPAMIGLGLLEALDEATITAREDPDDADHDGISGRANRVWDYAAQAVRLGRFGWKANQPSLRQQTLGAFNGDMGITSSLFPSQNCTPSEALCASEISGVGAGETNELSDAFLNSVVHYAHTLAVPARRDIELPAVQRGAKVFAKVGCESCHTPELRTGDLENFPELSQQTIRPYTDLLLHDMGPELADHRPDFQASGTEWRTPPLWGIGLVQRVNGHTFFLHDGRARGFLEAVMYHGGEAEASREQVRALPKADRDALIAFLESL